MKVSLIICTYMRPQPLLDLLRSVALQTRYPDEILIIDGSRNDLTRKMLDENHFNGLHYFLVSDQDRGLTRQRNFGVARAQGEILCFLDDDTVLESDYFEQILTTYKTFPEALGVGGYIYNEATWQQINPQSSCTKNDFCYDGFKRKDGSRFLLRKKFGLAPDRPPGFLPDFAHGRSIGFLPPSGKTYPVEQLMGGVASFRKQVFEQFRFSPYFEGYGLYEDADFTLRVSRVGKLFINTSARLAHYHDHSGRPDKYTYGKMVVRNGWYVWRVRYPNPGSKARLKWHATNLLLTAIRFTNIFTTNKKREAFQETLGRTLGWFSLWFSKPKHQS